MVSTLSFMPDITVKSKGAMNGAQVHIATGPYGISTRLPKELSEELTPVFTIFFQVSLNQGVLPSELVNAGLLSIFKKGVKNKMENY